jgi:tetratricopeptide (TPR) repeat protein
MRRKSPQYLLEPPGDFAVKHGMITPNRFSLMLLATVSLWGCQRQPVSPEVPNPVLENSQAELQAVETRLAEKEQPSSRDYLDLAMARYRVWGIYLNRSNYGGGQAREHQEAASYARKAQQLEPRMVNAFERAMESQDPHVRAEAKVRLSSVYGGKQDWDQQIAMLRRILRDHADLNSPRAFGLFVRPQYYCYYTMAHALKSKGKKSEAINCLAKAILAADIARRNDVEVGDRFVQLLEQLTRDDPRLALPEYQRLLPTEVDGLADPNSSEKPKADTTWARLFDEYRNAAEARVCIEAVHVDHNGALVEYEVIIPGYAKIVEWQERANRTLSGIYFPSEFRLSFSALSTEHPLAKACVDASVFDFKASTQALAFDPDGRSVGRVILPWPNQNALRPKDIYLVAKLEQRWPSSWSPASWPKGIYTKPIKIALPER